MPQVALLVETALGSGRQILKGISQYVHEKNNWDVFHYTGSLGAMIPEVLSNWEGDGIIARINNKEVLDVINSKGVPIVDVLGNCPESEFPKVINDNEAITRMVLEHFEIRGFRSYAYLGVESEFWALEREQAFDRFSETMEGPFSCLKISHALKQSSTWTAYLSHLCPWLKSLPKPVGIYICSDQFAPDIIAACSATGFRIPEDVALIGVDNDLAFCEVLRPSLSSVRANHTQVGYTAASLLTEMMNGKTDVPNITRITPYAIEVRQSTDVFALQDDGLKRALIAIKERACAGVTVDEIAELTGYSRSVLQRKFRKTLGRSVHDLVVNVRINRAKELLTMTDIPIVEIALQAGFNHQEYLGMVFKRSTGFAPAQYRRHFSKV
jgi:LacI family transcriptional regulator